MNFMTSNDRVSSAPLVLETTRVTQVQFVTATWARRHIHEILDRAAAGATVVITRYGKPVAQIVAHDQQRSRPQPIEPLEKEERSEANS